MLTLVVVDQVRAEGRPIAGASRSGERWRGFGQPGASLGKEAAVAGRRMPTAAARAPTSLVPAAPGGASPSKGARPPAKSNGLVKGLIGSAFNSTLTECTAILLNQRVAL